MSEQNYTAAETSLRRRRSCSRWTPPHRTAAGGGRKSNKCSSWPFHGSASYHRCTDKIGPRVKMYLSAGELAKRKRKCMRRRKKTTNVVWFVNDVSRCWQSYSAVGHDSVAARTTTTTTRLPSLPHPENRTTTSVRQENRPTARQQRKTGKEKK